LTTPTGCSVRTSISMLVRLAANRIVFRSLETLLELPVTAPELWLREHLALERG